MDKQFDTVLNDCIEKITRGEATVEACVEAYPQFEELPDLLGLYASIAKVPGPEPSTDWFALSRIRVENTLTAHPVKVSNNPLERFGSHVKSHLDLFGRKPAPSSVAARIGIALVALGLVYGSTSLASASSSPSSPLYPVRQVNEQLGSLLTGVMGSAGANLERDGAASNIKSTTAGSSSLTLSPALSGSPAGDGTISQTMRPVTPTAMPTVPGTKMPATMPISSTPMVLMMGTATPGSMMSPTPRNNQNGMMGNPSGSQNVDGQSPMNQNQGQMGSEMPTPVPGGMMKGNATQAPMPQQTPGMGQSPLGQAPAVQRTPGTMMGDPTSGTTMSTPASGSTMGNPTPGSMMGNDPPQSPATSVPSQPPATQPAQGGNHMGSMATPSSESSIQQRSGGMRR